MAEMIIIPMMGLSPVSHMGHYYDMGQVLMSYRFSKLVGIGMKNAIFTANERIDVIKSQWFDNRTDLPEFVPVQSAGETVAMAYDMMPTFGRKTLNILVGGDRVAFGEGLKRSIEQGKIPELCGGRFDEVNVIVSQKDRKTHGFSGTAMRLAAQVNDRDEFERHLGPSCRPMSLEIFERTKEAIRDGRLSVSRK